MRVPFSPLTGATTEKHGRGDNETHALGMLGVLNALTCELCEAAGEGPQRVSAVFDDKWPNLKKFVDDKDKTPGVAITVEPQSVTVVAYCVDSVPYIYGVYDGPDQVDNANRACEKLLQAAGHRGWLRLVNVDRSLQKLVLPEKVPVPKPAVELEDEPLSAEPPATECI